MRQPRTEYRAAALANREDGRLAAVGQLVIRTRLRQLGRWLTYSSRTVVDDAQRWGTLPIRSVGRRTLT